MSNSSLLSKAISISDHPGPVFTGDPISRLKEIPTGINAPFDVFALICKEMQFNHAALLMTDSEDKTYFPIVYRNFDRTTAIRLQIPQESIEGLISGEIKIQRFFSYADSQTIHDYGLFDLSHGKTGIYLIYTITKGDSKQLIKDSFLEQNKKMITQKIISFDRSTKVKLQRNVGALFLIKANSFIKKSRSRNHSFYLFFIDAKKTLDRIINHEGFKDVNCFKIESKCHDIFANNIEDFGKITRINYGEYFLLVQLENSHSPELLKEHFDNSISADFTLNKKWKPLQIKYTKYFESVSTVGKAASLLLSGE